MKKEIKKKINERNEQIVYKLTNLPTGGHKLFVTKEPYIVGENIVFLTFRNNHFIYVEFGLNKVVSDRTIADKAADEVKRLRGALQYIAENDWQYTENGKSFGFLSKIAHAVLKESE